MSALSGAVVMLHRLNLCARRWLTRRLVGAPATGQSTLATGLACLFRRPLVRGATLVRRLATLPGDFTLLIAMHRRKAALFHSHGTPCSATHNPVIRFPIRGGHDSGSSNGCATCLVQ